jgi:hypothetical protein
MKEANIYTLIKFGAKPSNDHIKNGVYLLILYCTLDHFNPLGKISALKTAQCAERLSIFTPIKFIRLAPLVPGASPVNLFTCL